MTDQPKFLRLETALCTIINVHLQQGLIYSSGGASVYFDTLVFEDDAELVMCCKNVGIGNVMTGTFQVLPQEYIKLKAEAKALNLLQEPA